MSIAGITVNYVGISIVDITNKRVTIIENIEVLSDELSEIIRRVKNTVFEKIENKQLSIS